VVDDEGDKDVITGQFDAFEDDLKEHMRDYQPQREAPVLTAEASAKFGRGAADKRF
jgi:hypothetical protein